MIETNITESGVEIETSIRESGVRVVETSPSERITYDEKDREIMVEKEIVVRSVHFRRNRKK